MAKSAYIACVLVPLAVYAILGAPDWGTTLFLAQALGQPLGQQVPEGLTRHNLALGKPYQLSPPPSYQYCTDPDDDKQLTDGEYTKGYFWTQKSTVGWYLYSPQITVDLGQPEPIDGIMINCPGGGTAGVKFPEEITFLVSDDNELFHEVARLTPRGLKQDGKNWYTHKFLADALKTRGRYVMIRLDKSGSTVFADEIEIYRGRHDPSTVTFAGEARSRKAMAFAQYGVTPDSYRRGHFPEWPHIKWATPRADGPIKSILMAYSGDMREAVEVAQRLDLDYTPVQHFSYYRSTALGDLMQEQIIDALPECEVMIVGGYRWEATPKKLLEKIKTRVRDGMGLVCVSSVPNWLDPVRDVLDAAPLGDDQGVLDLVPVAAIPGYRKPRKSHLHLGTLGRGRVAWINWAAFGRGSHSLTPSFRLVDIDDDAMGPTEYAYAALSKVIQWAANRQTQRIENIDASAGTVLVTLAPGDAPSTLEVQVRDRYFDGGKPMTTQATVRVRGEMAGLRLAAVLRDAYGRQLTPEQVIPVGDDGMVALTLRHDHPLTLCALLSLELRKSFPGIHQVGTGRVQRHIERVWVDLPAKDDYTFCAWYAWDSQPIAFHGLRMLHDLGVDTYVSLPGAWRAENAAFVNMRHGPENVERVHPQNKDDSLVRLPCLTDPAYRSKVRDRIEQMAREVRPYGVLEWSLGDESTLGRRDYCHSPTCLAAFREYLKETHESLDELNAAWGTDFESWEKVVPATKQQVEGQKHLGPWLEHRRYMEKLFADYHAWCGELVLKHIPHAKSAFPARRESTPTAVTTGGN